VLEERTNKVWLYEVLYYIICEVLVHAFVDQTLHLFKVTLLRGLKELIFVRLKVIWGEWGEGEGGGGYLFF